MFPQFSTALLGGLDALGLAKLKETANNPMRAAFAFDLVVYEREEFVTHLYPPFGHFRERRLGWQRVHSGWLLKLNTVNEFLISSTYVYVVTDYVFTYLASSLP